MNLAMNSFPSIEFLHQSTKEAEDEASVRVFDGNPELLTLYDVAQGPLESVNIHSSNSGAIETSSSTLTGLSFEHRRTPQGSLFQKGSRSRNREQKV